MRLEGKVAIVTGAARGQGEATARLFAAQGARVAVVDILDEGRAVADSIGPMASFHKVDISKQADWERLRDELMADAGRIDVLINNAAVIIVEDLITMEQAAFERVLNINVVGTWLGIKVIGGQMVAAGKGSIVNILSVAALHGINGLGAYVATKWAIRGMSRTAAMEVGPKGVRVNCLLPGSIASPMYGAEEPRELTNKRFVGQPVQRIGEPEEIANTSLFLASDESSYIAGTEIIVDGGMTTGRYQKSMPCAPEGLV